MIWVTHLPQNDRKNFSNHVSQTLEDKTIKRLIQILLEKEYDLQTRFDYDVPNWAFLQAHNNGKIEMIEEILTLLTNKENK